MVIYLNETTTKKNNKKKESSNIDECIKRDYNIIVKETNMASQKAYKIFGDTCNGTKKEIDIFYKNNPSPPKVKDIDDYSNDCYVIILNYNGENYDVTLYFDEAVYHELKKSDKLKKLGYHLSHEDHLGILIEK